MAGIPNIHKIRYEWDKDKNPHLSLTINGEPVECGGIQELVIHQSGSYVPDVVFNTGRIEKQKELFRLLDNDRIRRLFPWQK